MAEGPADFASAWRKMLSDWEKQTNAAMNGVTATPEYNQIMGQYVAAGLRLQGMFASSVEQSLAKLNLPSRSDFKQVYAQLSEIEARLDRLTAAVEAGRARDEAAALPPGPKRTKKPPGADKAQS